MRFSPPAKRLNNARQWPPACAADGNSHLVMAAKAVELVQLVGSVAWTCSHLPDVDKWYTYYGAHNQKKQANPNLAVAVSSSLQPVQEKWYGW